MSKWQRARRQDVLVIVGLMLLVALLTLGTCDMPGLWSDIRG